jgi:DnaK suppressor protein
MDTYDPSMAARFSQLLQQREAELRAVLQALREDEHTPRPETEVTDFKDAASQDLQAGLDEAQARQAEAELEQIAAAQRRLQEGTYGDCVRCGNPIDLRRLTALPSTPYCIQCQTALEQQTGRPRAH